MGILCLGGGGEHSRCGEYAEYKQQSHSPGLGLLDPHEYNACLRAFIPCADEAGQIAANVAKLLRRYCTNLGQLLCPLLGVKRTSRFLGRMSAFDPKRT